MILQPSSREELCRVIATAYAHNKKIHKVELGAINRIADYTPEDMTVTVETGITLATLQKHLAQSGQWLSIDPPHPESTPIGTILANNLSGPRRFGYGMIREYLIGMKVVLPDGQLIKTGGKVVKNVAGYDLCKLFVGSCGTLGIIIEATFKLQPLPEMEKFLQIQCKSLHEVETYLHSILNSSLAPVVLDLHNLPALNSKSSTIFSIVIGFSGMKEDVMWQVTLAEKLGLSQPSDLDHEIKFWKDSSRVPLKRVSLLPSKLIPFLDKFVNTPFVARAGNGLLWYRDGSKVQQTELPIKLIQRIKEMYDPKHIFPDLLINNGTL